MDLNLIDTAYDMDAGDDRWLDGVVHALRETLDDGLGIAGLLYEARNDGELRFLAYGSRNLPPSIAVDSLKALPFLVADGAALRNLSTLTCFTASDLGSVCIDQVVDRLGGHGVRDIQCLNGMAAPGRGVLILVNLRRRRSLAPQTRERWTAVAQHLGRAHALRLRVRALDGTLARSAGLRKRSHARKPDGTERSLEERFALLSRRERDVLTSSARGELLKVVAYDLKISPSTARVLLLRARRKVGVASTDELLMLRERLERRS